MSISFMSLQNSGSSEWNIVQKSFPKFIEKNSVQLSVTVKVVGEKYKDKKAAEIAAVKMSELNKLSYVSDNTSVITVTPFCGGFLPVELTPEGKIMGQGINSANLTTSITSALKVAASKKALYIAPTFD